jgi:hypothetical protein
MGTRNQDFDPDFDNMDDDTSVLLPGPGDDDADDASVEIDIVDDTPERDRNARPMDREVAEPTDEELASYGDKTRKRINELTHARHDERRKRETLEREHQAALAFMERTRRENEQLRKTLDEGAKQFGAMSVQAAETQLESARDQLRKASEAFDTEEIIKAQEALTDAKLELGRAKSFKAPTVQVTEDVVQTGQGSAPATPLHPKTQQWLDKNRWFTDKEHAPEASYALGLHNQLVQSGYDPRSDEYFTELDTRMKNSFPKLYSGRTAGAQDTTERRQSPNAGSVVAPVTRTAAGKQRVVLTQAQVALCKKLNITPQQYAAEIAKGA